MTDQENISSRFSSNFEANASELLENIDEMITDSRWEHGLYGICNQTSLSPPVTKIQIIVT